MEQFLSISTVELSNIEGVVGGTGYTYASVRFESGTLVEKHLYRNWCRVRSCNTSKGGHGAIYIVN